MSGILSLICTALLVAIHLENSSGQLNNCPMIEPCLTLSESACDAQGERQVCLVRTNLPGCTGIVNGNLCNANMIGVTGSSVATTSAAGATVCQQDVSGNVLFAVNEGTTSLVTGPSPRSITLSGRQCTCAGYGNFCSTGGNFDVLITCPVTPCPNTVTTVTTPTTGTTRTTSACNCTPYRDVGVCSTTCGIGSITRERFCYGSGCTPAGFQTMTASCVLRVCPTRVNGNWGQWGQWSDFVRVGRSRVQTRTRTRMCNNPPPSGGGSPCPGPASQTQSCPPSGGCRPIRPPCPPRRRCNRIRNPRRRRRCRRRNRCNRRRFG